MNRTRIHRLGVLPACIMLALAAGVTVVAGSATAAPNRPGTTSDDPPPPPRLSCTVEGTITFKPPLSKTKQKLTATVKKDTGKIITCKSKNGAPEGYTGGTFTGSASAEAACTLDINDLAIDGSITWNDGKGVSKFKVAANIMGEGEETDGIGTGTIIDGPFKNSTFRGTISDGGAEVSDCTFNGTPIEETIITKGRILITIKP
jgi:hypothetical protein